MLSPTPILGSSNLAQLTPGDPLILSSLVIRCSFEDDREGFQEGTLHKQRAFQ